MKSFKALVQSLKKTIQTKVKSKKTKIESNKINVQPKNKDTMSMYNYGVGGNEKKVDANEAIQEIKNNKTLLVSKLTTEEPMTPDIVTGLKTVEDVFQHYKPTVAVDHETTDGETVKEEFSFNNLGDFTPKNLVENSEFLKNLSLEQEQYNNIIRQLRNNKVLKNMLADPQSKAAFIEVLKSVATELETNK